MLFYTRNAKDISEHVSKIESIRVEAPIPGEEDSSLKIQKAEIVRSTYNKRHKIFFHGVHFLTTSTEEEQIMKFIRKRELQLLRKGITDK
jgi:hypothetical protein